MAVTVYGFYGSFCTQKVYLALAEKGVQARRRLVNIGPPMENYEPWYARLNPQMVVPTLEHDGEVICDSARIIRYIDESFEGPPLLPLDPDLRRRVERIVDQIDGLRIRELSYARLRGFFGVMRDRVIQPRRLRKLREYRATAPELRDVYDARIADVTAWNATMTQPAQMDVLRSELVAVLDELEANLAESAFVVGDAYSLADLMATVLCARMRLMGLADLEQYPRLSAHYSRMRARPGFPSGDIIEKMDRRKMLSIVGPFLAPRLAVLLLVVAVLTALLVYALR